MKRYVIYSALVKKYDEILQPLVLDDRFDYVLFSDDITTEKVGIWQVRPIPYHNDDPTRVCRFVKTHPEELLDEYDVSIWIDSNISILTDFIYHRAVELDELDIPVSSMYHPSRNCIYKEAFAVVNLMVEHESVVIDWCHRLRKEGYPCNHGLCETNVVFRKHHTRSVREADDLWWRCISNYSRRDQLSFNYVLWKLEIPCHFFLGEGNNARNSNHLEVVQHKNRYYNIRHIDGNEAWLMRHCWKHKDETKKVERLYYRFYGWPFPRFWIALVGQYYRLKDR